MPVAVLCVCCRAAVPAGAGPPSACHLNNSPVILRRLSFFFFFGEVVTEVLCWAGCLVVQPLCLASSSCRDSWVQSVFRGKDP